MPSANSSSLEYYCLLPAHFRLDGGAMYGIIPKPLWNKVSPADEQNRIDLALRLLLIKSSERIVLVDTGIGDYHGEKFDVRFDVRGKKSPLVAALNEIGLGPEDVTDLVISHLHFDHVGGIGEMQDGVMKAVLPKARCHIHKSHFEYAHKPTERDTGSFHTGYFDPVIDYYKDNGLLHWYEGEEGELFEISKGETLRFKCSHGHTPWLMHPYTRDVIYLADLIPTSNHVHIPWVMGYDIAPGITVADKRNFLEFIAKNNLTVIYEHDPEYWGSKIALSEKNGFDPATKQKCEKRASYLLHIS